MRGIIIAAGLGMRLRPLTEDLPKCMLPVAGRTILQHTMACLRGAGCDEIVVIVGHGADKIDADRARIIVNTDYAENNILHSLMKARDYLDGPVICSYSDIWVEPEIHGQLLAADGDIVLAVDRDWLPYYEGRELHPVREAENVFFDHSHRVRQIGKHLRPEDAGEQVCGEFLGLWRMTAAGTRLLTETFASLNATLGRDDAFQNAALWRKAYITDMVQEFVDRGHPIGCAVIERGWAEIDTVEDYQRLSSIAERQRLRTISKTIGTA